MSQQRIGSILLLVGVMVCVGVASELRQYWPVYGGAIAGIFIGVGTGLASGRLKISAQ